MMNKNVLMIGGDLRIIKLSEMLAEDGFNIYTYALEKAEDLKKYHIITNCEDLEQIAKDCELIITSIPFSSNKQDVNTPFSDMKLKIETLFNSLQGKKIISGNIDETIGKIAKEKNIEIIDLFKREELTILNTISTAEGAIQIAMEETIKTIHGSNILVMGFGRVGKMVSKMFWNIGANVYCEARKTEDLAWIKAYGYKAVSLRNLDKYLNKFDVIINTIPAKILDEDRLKLLKQDCLIIDLASAPGGVDNKVAKDLEIKTIWALSLPRKSCSRNISTIYKRNNL